MLSTRYRYMIAAVAVASALPAEAWAEAQFSIGPQSVFVGTPAQLRSIFEKLGDSGAVQPEYKNSWRVFVNEDDATLLDPDSAGCLACNQVPKRPKPRPIPCAKGEPPPILEKFGDMKPAQVEGFQVTASTQEFFSGFLGNDQSGDQPIAVVADLDAYSSSDIEKKLKEICPACGQVEPLPKPMPLPICK
jgi:hypothetical protein